MYSHKKRSRRQYKGVLHHYISRYANADIKCIIFFNHKQLSCTNLIELCSWLKIYKASDLGLDKLTMKIEFVENYKNWNIENKSQASFQFQKEYHYIRELCTHHVKNIELQYRHPIDLSTLLTMMSPSSVNSRLIFSPSVESTRRSTSLPPSSVNTNCNII